MGAYQTFGDLLLELDGDAGGPGVSCESDQRPYFADEDVASDGRRPGRHEVVRRARRPAGRLGAAPPRPGGAVRLCPDELPGPARAGPEDLGARGVRRRREWTVLDRRTDEPPIPSRGGTKTYAFPNSDGVLVLADLVPRPHHGESHLQIAEIAFAGIEPRGRRRPAPPAATATSGPCRSPDGVHRVDVPPGRRGPRPDRLREPSRSGDRPPVVRRPARRRDRRASACAAPTARPRPRRERPEVRGRPPERPRLRGAGPRHREGRHGRSRRAGLPLR